MSSKVSIILPVYNGEKTLKNTVESLLAQSYRNFELIACIDGTKDGSEAILRGIKDVRIKIIRNEDNMGLGRTMNRLVSSCDAASEYIAVAEQDDWYYPERLKLQVAYLDSHKTVGLISGIGEHVADDKVVFKFPEILVNGGQYPTDKIEMFKLNYIEQIKVVNTCMMFRKSVHQNKGLYFTQHYPSLGVDWTYIVRFSLHAQIAGLNVPLVRMDRNANRNSLTSDKMKQFEASRELIRSLYYEYSHILTKADYKAAMNSQHLLEGATLNVFQAIKRSGKMIANKPNDGKLLTLMANIKKRFLRKLGL